MFVVKIGGNEYIIAKMITIFYKYGHVNLKMLALESRDQYKLNIIIKIVHCAEAHHFTTIVSNSESKRRILSKYVLLFQKCLPVW